MRVQPLIKGEETDAAAADEAGNQKADAPSGSENGQKAGAPADGGNDQPAGSAGAPKDKKMDRNSRTGGM